MDTLVFMSNVVRAKVQTTQVNDTEENLQSEPRHKFIYSVTPDEVTGNLPI